MDKIELINIAIKALEELKETTIDNIGIEVTEVQQGQFNLEINAYYQIEESKAMQAENSQYLG